MAAVYASAGSAGAALTQLLEERTAKLAASGVDVSCLSQPARGAVASVGGRRGWFVDQVTLTMRAGDVLAYGSDGGGGIDEMELHDGERIVGASQWYSGQYLGSRVALPTSDGRELAVEGTHYDESDGERWHAELTEEEEEIVGLAFEDGRLSGVSVRGADGVDRHVQCEPEDDLWADPEAAEESEDDEDDEGEEDETEGEDDDATAEDDALPPLIDSGMLAATSAEEEALQHVGTGPTNTIPSLARAVRPPAARCDGACRASAAH
jgi:hypothetical protein